MIIMNDCVFDCATIDNNQCSAHLINDGVSIEGNNVIIEFEGTGPNEVTQVSEFTCRLDSEPQVSCKL